MSETKTHNNNMTKERIEQCGIRLVKIMHENCGKIYLTID